MKLHKFADRKKEFLAMTLVGFIIVSISIYVVFLVNQLTKKVYNVFGRITDADTMAPQFNFEAFEELELRPRRATTTRVSVPVAPPASTLPASAATGTASSS